MTAVQVVPPARVLTLAETKQHLRVEYGEDDDLITALMDAAQGQIDGPDGWLGRALGVQSIEVQGIGPAGPIALPYPPIQTVVSVSDDRLVALDPSAYGLARGIVTLNSGQPWPWAAGGLGGTVRFTAGYPVTTAVGDVPAKWSGPPAVRAALLMMVADLYEHRSGQIAQSLTENRSVMALLSPFRIWAV